MKSIFIPLLAASWVAGLSGCQHPMGAPIGQFGDVVQHNIAMQVIDPEPLMEAPPPDHDGGRAALAFARYREDSAGRIQGPKPDRVDIESTEKQVGLPDEGFFKTLLE